MSTLATALLCLTCVAPQNQERAERVPLVDGWLAELLDRDQKTAVQKYRDVARNDEAPMAQRAIAIARIVEIESEIDWTALGGNTARTGPPFRFPRVEEGRRREFAALDAEFAQALSTPEGPARDATLLTLRDRLDEVLKGRDNADLRGHVATAIQWVTSTGRDPRRVSSSPNERSLRRGRALEILRLRLDGTDSQTEQADRLESTTRNLRGPRTRSLPVVPMPADPAGALRTAIARLKAKVARPGADVAAEERQLLRKLIDRLVAFEAAGDVDGAIRLLRSLPLYDVDLLGN
jgi:hypothetical protein